MQQKNLASLSNDELIKLYQEANKQNAPQDGQDFSNLSNEELTALYKQHEPSVLDRVGEGIQTVLDPIEQLGAGMAQGGLNTAALIGNIPRYIGKGAEYLNIPYAKELAKIPEVVAPTAPLYTGSPVSQIGELLSPITGFGTALTTDLIKAPNVLKTLFPGNQASAQAKNFLSNLTKGSSLDSAHNAAKNILNNMKFKNMAQSSENYNNVLSAAENAGYHSDFIKSMLSGAPKLIESDIVKKLRPEEIGQLSENTRNALMKFDFNPSLRGAHEVQSRLAEDASSLFRSASRDDKLLGKKLNSLSQDLRSNIYETFAKHGDENIANAYKAATRFHRENVIPFTKNVSLNKILMGDADSRNLANVIGKDTTYMNKVKDLMSDSTKDLLVASKLRGELPLIGDVNPGSIVNKINKLKSQGMSELVTRNARSQVNSINNLIGKDKKLKKIADKFSDLAPLALLEETLRRSMRGLSSDEESANEE